MAISSTTSELSFTGNASDSTPYPLTGLRYDDNAWLAVTETQADGTRVPLTEGIHYTLTGNGKESAGSLTSTTGNEIPATSTLHVARNTPATQLSEFENDVPLNHDALEDALDKRTMAEQDQNRDASAGLGRTIRTPQGEALAELPDAADRVGRVPYFDDTTGDLETLTPNQLLALSDGAPDGVGIPAGGTTGQVLTKASGDDYDGAWQDSQGITDAPNDGLQYGRQSQAWTPVNTSGSADVNLHNLGGFLSGLGDYDSTDYGQPYVGIILNGDSMVGASLVQFAQQMQSAYGVGGWCSPNIGSSTNGLSWSYTGGAYQANDGANRGNPASYIYFKGAHQIVMPVGSTAEVAISTSSGTQSSTSSLEDYLWARDFMDAQSVYTGAKRIEFLYIKRPGGGTITLEITSSDGVAYPNIVINTNDPATALDSVDFTPINLAANYSVRAVCSVAESHFVGWIAYKDKGIIAINSAVGGTNMELWANSYVGGSLSPFDQALFDKINPRAFIYLQRASDSIDPVAAFTEYFNAVEVYSDRVSHLCLGEPCISPAENAELITLNNIQRNECLTRGWFFLDLLAAYGGSSKIPDELGWTSADAIHQYGLGSRAWASLLWATVQAGARVLGANDPTTAGSPWVQSQRWTMELMLQKAHGTDQTLNAESSWDGETITGTASKSFTNERGLILTIGAGVTGEIVGRVCNLLTGNTAINTPNQSFTLMLSSYRGMTPGEGCRASYVLGNSNSAIVQPALLTGRAMGLEFAHVNDPTLPTLPGGQPFAHPARFFWHDGTSINYSEWFDNRPNYSATPSSRMATNTIQWDAELGRVSVWIDWGIDFPAKLFSMDLPLFKTQTLPSHWLKAGIYDNGAATVGSTNWNLKRVQMNTTHIRATLPYPYGIKGFTRP